VEDSFERQQQQASWPGPGSPARDHAGGVRATQEHRQPVPGHARRAQAVDLTMKFSPGRNGRKTAMKTPTIAATHGPSNRRSTAGCTKVQPVSTHRQTAHRGRRSRQWTNRYQLARFKSREGQVAGASIKGTIMKLPRCRHRGDQEEPHHHHAVHGEQPIVCLRRRDQTLRTTRFSRISAAACRRQRKRS